MTASRPGDGAGDGRGPDGDPAHSSQAARSGTVQAAVPGSGGGVGYPPEPWALTGQLHASVFLVPIADVAPFDLPPGIAPIVLGSRVVIATAWVHYEPGSVLTYRELMATLLVRHGRRLLPTILAIWVDSVASRDGGRGLWGIPKELAEFEAAGGSWSARTADGPICAGTVRPRVRLPGRLPVDFAVVQALHGARKISPVRSRAALTLDAATFRADPDGPLGFLAGRRPLVSVSMRDFRMRFGG